MNTCSAPYCELFTSLTLLGVPPTVGFAEKLRRAISTPGFATEGAGFSASAAAARAELTETPRPQSAAAARLPGERNQARVAAERRARSCPRGAAIDMRSAPFFSSVRLRRAGCQSGRRALEPSGFRPTGLGWTELTRTPHVLLHHAGMGEAPTAQHANGRQPDRQHHDDHWLESKRHSIRAPTRSRRAATT